MGDLTKANEVRQKRVLEKTENAAIPYKNWVSLKVEYLSSDYNEVAEFLRSKGIDADDYSYTKTRGWRREKMENLKKSLYLAEKKHLDASVEKLEEKIKRRSTWWKTIQQAIVRKLLTTDSEGKQAFRDDISSEELFFLTKSYDIAVKGERLEDGQPTVVEKIDQVNTHTFSFEELSPDAFSSLEEEMERALLPSGDVKPDNEPHDDSQENPVPRDEARGDGGEDVPPSVLP